MNFSLSGGNTDHHGPTETLRPVMGVQLVLASLYSTQSQFKQSADGTALTLFSNALQNFHGLSIAETVFVTAEFGKSLGNHIHTDRTEIIVPLEGDALVLLEHPNSSARDKVNISAERGHLLVIPAGIAHRLIVRSNTASFLLMSERADALSRTLAYSVERTKQDDSEGLSIPVTRELEEAREQARLEQARNNTRPRPDPEAEVREAPLKPVAEPAARPAPRKEPEAPIPKPDPALKLDPIPVHIRWMIRRDMPEVLKIEDQCFEFPWMEEDFIRALRQRNCIGMVAESNERILGFMVYELHKHRLHVLNLAVDDNFRRRDVGTQLVKKLQGKLSPERRSQLVLEVRESNLPAQNFFKEMGFQCTSVLQNFYEDTPEDAYLFRFRGTDRKGSITSDDEL